MPMHWNDRTDARLFAAVIKIHNIKINYEKVAELMGPDCTAKAISHRVSKLKEKCRGDFAGIHVEPVHAADAFVPKQRAFSDSPGAGTPAPTTTPRRRGRPPGSSSLKRVKQEVESGDEEEEEEVQLADRGSPSIRKKAKIVKSRKSLPDCPSSSTSPVSDFTSSSTSSSPATLESVSSPPETAARENSMMPVPQPNFYHIEGASPNVKAEPLEEDDTQGLENTNDILSTLPMFFGGEHAAMDPLQDPHMSFMGMNMSFDFWSPEWENYRAEDSFADYNE